MSDLKGFKYVVMVNYGLEGWKPWAEIDDFDEAVEKWKEAMGNGNREVWIMKPLKLKIQENA